MRLMSSNRRRSGRQVRTVASQQLESRQLPTGIVNVAVSAAGDLVVTGDDASNQIDINVDSAGIHVVGSGGTSVRYRGATVGAGTSVKLDTPLPVRDVRVNMKGGNDVVNLNARSALAIGGIASVALGTGADKLNVNAFAGVSVTGNATITGESGNDSIAIRSRGGLVDFKAGLSIDSGVDNDAVRISDETTFSSVTNASGLLGLANTSVTANSQRIRVGGNLSVSTGQGSDSVAILGVETRGNATVNSGDQLDKVGVSSLRVGGTMSLSGSETTALTNTTVAGAMTVRGSVTNDRMAIHNAEAGSINLDQLEGDDQLSITGRFRVRSTTRLNGGAGWNRIDSSTALAAGAVVNFRSAALDELSIIDSVMASVALRGI